MEKPWGAFVPELNRERSQKQWWLLFMYSAEQKLDQQNNWYLRAWGRNAARGNSLAVQRQSQRGKTTDVSGKYKSLQWRRHCSSNAYIASDDSHGLKEIKHTEICHITPDTEIQLSSNAFFCLFLLGESPHDSCRIRTSIKSQNRLCILIICTWKVTWSRNRRRSGLKMEVVCRVTTFRRWFCGTPSVTNSPAR
jgi:hypothetical protein